MLTNFMNINELYSSDELKKILTYLGEALPQYLNQTSKKDIGTYADPHELLKISHNLIKNPSPDIENTLKHLIDLWLKSARHLHSPRYIGHQVSVPIPFAAALEAVSGIINQGGAIFEMGPLLTAAEKAIVELLATFISTEHVFEGIVTHGGTLANLTALLAARNFYFKNSFLQGTTFQNKKIAIITSSDAHYSISRAMAVMGFGAEQVLKAPIHADNRKINNELLEKFYEQKTKEGYHIFCVVGSACSTPTGAIDDLEYLAEFSKKHQLWFHVDAAHGGGFLLSPRERKKFKGIEEADSIVWDAHKMMFVPALCTFVFYKRKADSYQVFAQQAPYLFGEDDQLFDFEAGLRTMECTRGSLILPLFSVLCTIGTQGIAELNEHLIDQTHYFYEKLKAQSDFEVMHEPQANILCFRYLPQNFQGDYNQLQDQIRMNLMKNSLFYLTGTNLDGKRCLRVTVMNPQTTKEDFDHLVFTIRQ